MPVLQAKPISYRLSCILIAAYMKVKHFRLSFHFSKTLDKASEFVYYSQAQAFRERYRSGHNEAVLKTVWGQLHMGSNPILSVRTVPPIRELNTAGHRHIFDTAEVPKWSKGLAWKVSRSLIAAHGFKSHLLRNN